MPKNIKFLITQQPDDGDAGNKQRINKLKDTDELLGHSMAHAKGEYEYQTGGMHNMNEDRRWELEIENNERWGYNPVVEGEHVEERQDQPEAEYSDMDIQSDSE